LAYYLVFFPEKNAAGWLTDLTGNLKWTIYIFFIINQQTVLFNIGSQSLLLCGCVYMVV
jgi:hypothetical protein